MWAQLISMRLKPGNDERYEGLMQTFRSTEQPGSGLVRSTSMRDQNDPSRVYTMVVFESEEAARARESDPRRAEALQSVRDTMAEIFEGPPEFIDLEVIEDFTP